MQGFKLPGNGMGAHKEHRMGVWGFVPTGIQGYSPRQGAKAPEAESILAFTRAKERQI